MAVDRAEDRPTHDAALAESVVQGAHRAGKWVGAERQTDFATNAFLIGLGGAQLDHESVRGKVTSPTSSDTSSERREEEPRRIGRWVVGIGGGASTIVVIWERGPTAA